MISNVAVVIFCVALFLMAMFFIWSIRKKEERGLIHKIYLILAGAYSIWLLALLGMRIVGEGHTGILFCLDAVTNSVGVFIPVLSLLISLVFVKGYERLPRKYYALFILPIISNVVIWTNPLHHLQYVRFSIVRSEIIFGPYLAISGLYSAACLLVGLIIMIRFVRKNHSRLYIMQGALFIAGNLVPLTVSAISTFSQNSNITYTPISFMCSILLAGIAIYKLHFLDVKPLAVQKIMERISDDYLVLSDKELVISYNMSFVRDFGEKYHIAENKFLADCVKETMPHEKAMLFNLMNALDSCRESGSTITYEQADTVIRTDGKPAKNYFIVEVTPLYQEDKLSGFAVLFKDVTQLKKSLQQLQDNQQRMMEQEQLAFLGQMIGGLAHNLKTPIMSISGCVSAIRSLVDEYRESLDDPQVIKEDYEEICDDIDSWLEKIIMSTGYMSDIITAIKGQAAASSTEETPNQQFTVDEMIKRSWLLMRHELQKNQCTLVTDNGGDQEIILHGDINNMVQVVTNLLSNAVYAQNEVGGGEIYLTVKPEKDILKIQVADHGKGVSKEIGRKLFRKMVTSKGIHGNGLGLYISYTVIRGKFGGDMWYEDNPGGGAIFGISIPMDHVEIIEAPEKEDAYEKE